MRRSLAALLLVSCPLWGGASRDLDSPGDAISIAGVENSSSLSVVVWLYSDSNAGGNHCPASRMDGSSDAWEICYTTGNVLWWAHSANWAVNTTAYSGFGEWVHVALCYDSASGTTVYANGSSVDTDGATGALDITADIKVGVRDFPGIQDWEGAIAYLHIYSRSLSQVEVRQLMHHPGSIADGLVGYWPFWESGTTHADLSGSGNAASSTGTVEHFSGPHVFIGAMQ